MTVELTIHLISRFTSIAKKIIVRILFYVSCIYVRAFAQCLKFYIYTKKDETRREQRATSVSFVSVRSRLRILTLAISRFALLLGIHFGRGLYAIVKPRRAQELKEISRSKVSVKIREYEKSGNECSIGQSESRTMQESIISIWSDFQYPGRVCRVKGNG